jgi:hypothetical protein
MLPAVLTVPLALCLLQPAAATLEIAVGTSVILSASQVGFLALIALYGKLGVGKKLGGQLLGRGRREAVDTGYMVPLAEEGVEISLEQVAALEVEDCYKRVFCAAASGGLAGSGVEGILALLQPLSTGAKEEDRIREAAVYGMSR